MSCNIIPLQINFIDYNEKRQLENNNGAYKKLKTKISVTEINYPIRHKYLRNTFHWIYQYIAKYKFEFDALHKTKNKIKYVQKGLE